MSTRGYIGYIYRGKVRGSFNHWDSYPRALGRKVLEVYAKYTWQEIKDFFLKKLEFITEEKFYAMTDSLVKKQARVKDANLSPYLHRFPHMKGRGKPEYNERAILDHDWKKPGRFTWHEEKEGFYKDAIFCEYSYLFDLDSATKRLLVFTGFGKKPSKGYESWFTIGSGDDKHKLYMRKALAVTADLQPADAEALFNAYLDMEVACNPSYKTLRKVRKCSGKELLGYIHLELDSSTEEDLVKHIVEFRLKGLKLTGEPV